MEKLLAKTKQPMLAKHVGPGLAAQAQAAQIFRALGGTQEEQKQSLEEAFDHLNLTADQLEWRKDTRPSLGQVAMDFGVSPYQAKRAAQLYA